MGRTGVALALAVAVLVLLATGAFAGAVEVARARGQAGSSVVQRGDQRLPVTPGTQFQEGDLLNVPTDGQLTVEFEDGSSFTLAGPSSVLFGKMSADGRRIVLRSGAISEATVKGVALEIQAPQPYDASLVLQNARGFARVTPGERISFRKIEGDYAKAWRAGQSQDLGDATWTINLREAGAGGLPSGPARGPAAGQAQQLPGDTVQIRLGERLITYKPASQFRREPLPEEGVRLCYQGDDFGVVMVGTDTVLFLANGECVEFDATGHVTRFDGIAHIYHPLSDEFMFDEPVENAADASPSNPRRR